MNEAFYRDDLQNSKPAQITHSFSRTLARRYGINGAILMAFLANRISACQTTRNDNNGYFASVKDLAAHYPYLTENVVSYTLSQLRKEGVLNVENHNKKAYDRTLWYAFADPDVQKVASEDPVRFNVEVAKLFGVEAALVLANIKYWISENRKKNSNFTWLRVSPKELSNHLPIPERTIRRALESLSEGENRLLDRKPCNGFDRAFHYCILENGNIDRPNSGNDRPNSEMHVTDFHDHRPISNIQRPNPRTYTYYKEYIKKISIEKNHCEKHIQTPNVCVCVSNDDACGAKSDDVPLSAAPSISASGHYRGQSNGRAVTPNQIKSNCSASDSIIAPQSDPFSPSVQETSDLDESPLAHLENDANLSTEDKLLTFKAAINNRNNNGDGFIYNGKTFEKARRFFDLNPHKAVDSLLDVLDSCAFRRMFAREYAGSGYDEIFYVRRSNNLNFFFKHLHQFKASDIDINGSLIDAIYYEDEGEILEAQSALPKTI